MIMSKRRSQRQLSFHKPSPTAVCAICLGYHSRTSSPREWKNQRAQECIHSMNVSKDSLVCRSCRDDVSRVLANPGYIPRWERRGIQSSNNNYCCVSNCSQVSFTQTKMGTDEELKSIQEITFDSESVPTPTPLCNHHYHVVYDALHSRHKHCTTCGGRFQSGNDRAPAFIEKYVSLHTDFDGHIQTGDRVCFTCYKSHLVI